MKDYITADWLVVAAGYTGLAAVRRLAEYRPDEQIVVLEVGVCGENAWGRNSGFASDIPHMDSLDAAKVAADLAYTCLSRAGGASLEEQVKNLDLIAIGR